MRTAQSFLYTTEVESLVPKIVTEGMSLPSGRNSDSFGTNACGKLALGSWGVPSILDHAPIEHLQPMILNKTQLCA